MASLLASDLLLPALLLAGREAQLAQHGALATPTVNESDAGWTITLAAAGLQPKDVSVSVLSREGSHSLRMQSDTFRHALRLPAKADAENVKASLVHGLLRVAVPRLPKRHLEIATSAEPFKKPVEGEAAHPEEATVTLSVPGIAPSEVKVTVEDEMLIINAQSEHGFGSYFERYKLPEHAVVDKISASCVHGIVSVRVPITPDQVHKVAISDDIKLLLDEKGEAEAEDAGKKGRHELLQLTVPGWSASDFAAEVRGRVMHLSGARENDAGRVVLRRSVALPAGVPVEAVQVVCANGVVRAWLPRSALEAAVKETTVPVSDQPLALLAPFSASTRSRKRSAHEMEENGHGADAAAAATAKETTPQGAPQSKK